MLSPNSFLAPVFHYVCVGCKVSTMVFRFVSYHEEKQLRAFNDFRRNKYLYQHIFTTSLDKFSCAKPTIDFFSSCGT